MLNQRGVLACAARLGECGTHLLDACTNALQLSGNLAAARLLRLHCLADAQTTLKLCLLFQACALQFGDRAAVTRHHVVAAALVERFKCLVEAADVVHVVEEISKPGGDAAVVLAVGDQTLGEIGAALKSVGVDAKELLADRGRVGGGGLVGGQIKEGERIICLLGAEKAFDAEFSIGNLKLEAAAKGTSLPGGVFFAFVFVERATGGGGQTVKHRLDEHGERALAPAVLAVQDVESLLQIEVKTRQNAKGFHVNAKQSHSPTSSPERARKPQAITRSFSSSESEDAITRRTNSPLSEMSWR